MQQARECIRERELLDKGEKKKNTWGREIRTRALRERK